MKKILLIFAATLLSNLTFGQKIKDIIIKGDYNKAQKWLNKGENLDQLLNVTDNKGKAYTFHPLEYACVKQQFEIAELFIENSDKFKNIKEYYNSAFSSTIQFNNIDFTKYMLALGVDVNVYCSICNNTPPIAIALYYNNFEIYNLLLTKGARLKNEGAGRYDVIHAAAGCDSLPILKYLVEVEGLNIEALTKWGSTPIFNAFQKGKIENAKYLVGKSADFSKKDSEGHSILYSASNYQTFIYAEELLKNTSIQNNDLNDACNIIALDDKELFDHYIVTYKDHLKTKSEEGYDIFFGLFFSEKHVNDEYFIKKLKALKLKPRPDKQGKTAYDYAKMSKQKELVNLFKKYFDL
jgi:ankyrin repeat protein